MSFVPFDMTVESEQTPRILCRRCCARIERDLGGTFAATDLETTLDGPAGRSIGSDLARGEFEIFKLVEIVLINLPGVALGRVVFVQLESGSSALG